MKLLMLKRYILYTKIIWFKKRNLCDWRLLKIQWQTLFFLSYFCCLFFSTCDFVLLLCNFERAGFRPSGRGLGGISGSNHIMTFIWSFSLRFTVVSVFKRFFMRVRSACSCQNFCLSTTGRGLPTCHSKPQWKHLIGCFFLGFQLLTQRLCRSISSLWEINLFI